jgi:tetratricopeptide (TPR) repeat protein
MMPYLQNRRFTGREDLLSQLREKLCKENPKEYNHRVAIYGLGGVGKSQIAIEYVYRYKQNYTNIYWVNASDQASLLSGFQKIGTKTKCVENVADLKPTEVAEAVCLWLPQQESWLLIIDNLDDLSVVDNYLPETHKGGHTLITTRNRNAPDILAKGFEVPLLCENEAIDLLCIGSKPDNKVKYSDVERSYAVPVIQELGCLALAIVQASAFIRKCCRGDISEYLPLYQTSRKRILEELPVGQSKYPYSVAGTFLLSFGKVSPEAAGLLRLFAFLNPDGILLDFIRAGSQGMNDKMKETINDEFVFRKALASLEEYSLVSSSVSEGCIVVHRLVQAVMKDTLSDTGDLDTYRNEVIDVCDAAFPATESLTVEIRQLCRRFQNQVVEPVFEASKVQSQPAVFTLSRIAWFLYNDGKYRDAERLFEQCCNITNSLGEEHPDTLLSISNLALTYSQQGKMDKAAELQEKVLEAGRRILGEEHPDTLSSMNNLASTYSQQGKMD